MMQANELVVLLYILGVVSLGHGSIAKIVWSTNTYGFLSRIFFIFQVYIFLAPLEMIWDTFLLLKVNLQSPGFTTSALPMLSVRRGLIASWVGREKSMEHLILHFQIYVDLWHKCYSWWRWIGRPWLLASRIFLINSQGKSKLRQRWDGTTIY